MRRGKQRGMGGHDFHGKPTLSMKQQEVLEHIWRAEEREGKATSSIIKEKINIPQQGEILEELESLSLIERKEGKIHLKKKGRAEAEKLIRQNRLAEVLFTEVFEMTPEVASEIACWFEHIALSDDVTDSICTFLGHPPNSPDGRKIPSGDCCTQERKELKPIVKPLSNLNVGEEGKVIFLKPSTHKFLDNLSSFGIVPGTNVKLHQKKPSLVILFDGTTLALDNEVGNDIFIRTYNRDGNSDEK